MVPEKLVDVGLVDDIVGSRMIQRHYSGEAVSIKLGVETRTRRNQPFDDVHRKNFR
jgi:hypothetical protein